MEGRLVTNIFRLSSLNLKTGVELYKRPEFIIYNKREDMKVSAKRKLIDQLKLSDYNGGHDCMSGLTNKGRKKWFRYNFTMITTPKI